MGSGQTLTEQQHFAPEPSPDPPEASPNKRPAACHPSNNTDGYLGPLLRGRYQPMSLQGGSRQTLKTYSKGEKTPQDQRYFKPQDVITV